MSTEVLGLMITIVFELFIFIFFYGQLVQKVKSNKEITDNRIDNLQEQIDSLERKSEDVNTIMIDVKVTLSKLLTEISYIKEHIKK